MISDDGCEARGGGFLFSPVRVYMDRTTKRRMNEQGVASYFVSENIVCSTVHSVCLAPPETCGSSADDLWGAELCDRLLESLVMIRSWPDLTMQRCGEGAAGWFLAEGTIRPQGWRKQRASVAF